MSSAFICISVSAYLDSCLHVHGQLLLAELLGALQHQVGYVGFAVAAQQRPAERCHVGCLVVAGRVCAAVACCLLAALGGAVGQCGGGLLARR